MKVRYSGPHPLVDVISGDRVIAEDVPRGVAVPVGIGDGAIPADVAQSLIEQETWSVVPEAAAPLVPAQPATPVTPAPTTTTQGA